MSRDGFGLIEVMIAMILFTVGVLALAGTTTYVGTQLRASDIRTERQVARQAVMEELRATPFETIATQSQAAAVVHGSYEIWWTVASPRWALKKVNVYTRGPAFRNNQLQVVVDTVEYLIPRPMP